MNKKKKVLLFINDFTDRGGEKFFLSSDDGMVESSAESVVAQDDELICHDYWLISPVLFGRTNSLPKFITDVEELRISTSGNREDRENRDKRDVFAALGSLLDEESIGQYRNIVFKSASIDVEVFNRVGDALLRLYDEVEEKAKNADEWTRYLDIERPVGDYLIRSAAKGIAINTEALREHKADIDFSYFMALKDFSARYSLPLDVPSNDEVVDYLSPRGFDFTGVGVDYVLNFVPMADGFSDRLLELRRIATSRMVLNAIPLSQKRIFPIVDAFGSITSRIYFKDPSLQNLSKVHRDILAPDEGMKLSYVDFDQYEAGIMGALSKDKNMLAMFASGDLYSLAAEQIFVDCSKRKQAKRLFLSYAYGMKRKSLIDSAIEFGAQRELAKCFFNQFSEFEAWKLEIWNEFKSKGRVGTALGNYLARSEEGSLSEREKRSAVSQVVQGTASLIFKKVLLRLSSLQGIELKVPMHDAVLFQHQDKFDPMVVADLFSSVMTEHFNGFICGKASVANFLPK
jgi:DNA polymerase I-like protein with 3'-5' exonuclease and polymerase domains